MPRSRTSPTAPCAFRLAVAAAVFVAGCGQDAAPPPSFEAIHDMKDTMNLVLEPAADVIWDSAGQVITAEGVEDLAPTTEEEWVLVEHAAAVVAESGNLLMMPGRALDQGEWIEIARGLTRAGQRAKAAAVARDAEALFAAGGLVYNVCVSCHQQYWANRPIRPGSA